MKKRSYNYLFQYENFYNDERVVKLKYPFTEESLKNVLNRSKFKFKKKNRDLERKNKNI